MSSDLDQAAEIIQERAGFDPVEIAIVVGAGLMEAIEPLENEIAISYDELPGFPKMKSLGQENRLVIGNLEGVRIACLKGREHVYENGNANAMALPLEVLTLLGAGSLILTSACGSVDADLFPGALAVQTDHINLSGLNPLVGAHGDGGIVSLSRAYDERLNARMKRAAASSGTTFHEGVLMCFSGPSFETPAEVKMARTIGVQMIGHTGVNEVILARRLGVRVCSIAAITYFGAGFNKSDPSYIEARDVARQAAIGMRRLIRAFLRIKEGAYAAESTRTSILRKPIG